VRLSTPTRLPSILAERCEGRSVSDNGWSRRRRMGNPTAVVLDAPVMVAVIVGMDLLLFNDQS